MSPVATLVERSTLFLMLVALPGGNHKADAVANALAAAVTTLPDQLGCSPTGSNARVAGQSWAWWPRMTPSSRPSLVHSA